MPERPQQHPREGYFAVGRVLRPWGLRGHLKVEPLTDFPERFAPGAEVWIGGERRVVEDGRWQDGIVYLKIAGLESPDTAETVRGLLLEVPDAELRVLPEGEFYEHQLVGLNVRTTTGEDLGTVAELLDPGPNSVLVVRGARGDILVPFIDDIIQCVDLDAHLIEIDPIEGLLPEPKPDRPPRFKRHQGRRQRRAAAQEGPAPTANPSPSTGGGE